jgi:hypothetical protein
VIADIAPRIIRENEGSAPSEVMEAFRALVTEIIRPEGESTRLRGLEDGGPDVEQWRVILEAAERDRGDRNEWYSVPWIVGEYYFYRRVAEAFRFFPSGYDPYAETKLEGLLSSLAAVSDVACIWVRGRAEGDRLSETLTFGLLTSLWGNKKDLSLWPTRRDDIKAGGEDLFSPLSSTSLHVPSLSAALEVVMLQQDRILDNDCSAVIAHLVRKSAQHGPQRVGVVVDNAGYELFCDLFLGHVLLQTGVASQVVFYTKGYPTFVSDARTHDCLETIRILSSLWTAHGVSSVDVTVTLNGAERALILPACHNTQRLGSLFQEHVASGGFTFQEDTYWCLPTAFADMPSSIRQELSQNVVTVIKGDANYRRLMDDRTCPFDTPSADVLSTWTSPVCALRALKSEIGCGIAPDRVAYAQRLDQKWRVSGDWGVVQFFDPKMHAANHTAAMCEINGNE